MALLGTAESMEHGPVRPLGERAPVARPILRVLFPVSQGAYEVLVIILAGCVACLGFPVLLVERGREWFSTRKAA